MLVRVKRKLECDPDSPPPDLVAIPMQNNSIIKRFKLQPAIKVEEGYDVYMSIAADLPSDSISDSNYTLIPEDEVDFLRWESADEDENAANDEDPDSNDEDYFANDYPDEDDYCYYENVGSDDERGFY